MNIYRITEDGESFCIKATTMDAACKICERSYLEDCEEDNSDFDESFERSHYQENILESCELVGPLKN